MGTLCHLKRQMRAPAVSRCRKSFWAKGLADPLGRSALMGRFMGVADRGVPGAGAASPDKP